VKVQNDGFDLWAQRRPSNKNDLPKATEILLQYKKDLLAWNEINLPDSEMTLLVTKEKIEENSEFNLSMDRYRGWNVVMNSNFELVKLWDICQIKTWKKDANFWTDDWEYPFFTCWREILKAPDFSFDTEAILIAWNGDVWACKYYKGKFEAYQRTYVLDNFDNTANIHYIFHVLNKNLRAYAISQVQGSAMPYIKLWTLQNYEIPLPPLEVQEKIVAELDSYQKVIDWAKMIVDNYKPTIKINPEWEMVKLGDYIKLSSWDFLPSSSQIEWEFLVYWWNWVTWTHNSYNTEKSKIIIWRVWAYCWCVHITKEKSWITDNALIVELLNSDINFSFLALILNQINLHRLAKVWGQPSISQSNILSEEIPLPTLEEQNQIVAEIEKEEAMVESVKQLIEVFEKKIKDRIDEIRGK
jgi:restriction endonuclease S subunit